MAPFLVEELKLLFLDAREWHFPIIALAPSSQYEATFRFENTDAFLDECLLIGHMLCRLARPDNVERVIWERHVHGVAASEVYIHDIPFHRELRCAFDLSWRDTDTSDSPVELHQRDGPTGASDSTSDI
jgi:hypothetical protein